MGVKYFKCSKCDYNPPVLLSNIVTNQDLILRLNRESKARMKLSDRKKCTHIWTRSTLHPDPAENLFECICCLRYITLPAESKEKLDKIDRYIHYDLELKAIGNCVSRFKNFSVTEATKNIHSVICMKISRVIIIRALMLPQLAKNYSQSLDFLLI